MKVIVVGGGIGGLSLALSLHQAGIAVRVYEAVRDLAPSGVGINLQPGAVRELTELGLGGELARTGIATQELSYFNKFGQLIWNEPRGLSAGYKWPQYSIHRGRLTILAAARDARARRRRRTTASGMRLDPVREQIHGQVAATFREQPRREQQFSDDADILVGADGVHSTVRRQLYPDEGRTTLRPAAPVAGSRRCRALAGRPHNDYRGALQSADHCLSDCVVVIRKASLLTNWICQMAVPHDAPQARRLESQCSERASTERRLISGDFRGSTFRN